MRPVPVCTWNDASACACGSLRRDPRAPERRGGHAFPAAARLPDRIPRTGRTAVHDDNLQIPLANLGQVFRTRGLALNLRQLRHAVAAGEAEAKRVGSRWLVSVAAAKDYAVPLGQSER